MGATGQQDTPGGGEELFARITQRHTGRHQDTVFPSFALRD
jgi:hypothetical protein